jgi:hypothetical protein
MKNVAFINNLGSISKSSILIFHISFKGNSNGSGVQTIHNEKDGLAHITNH